MPVQRIIRRLVYSQSQWGKPKSSLYRQFSSGSRRAPAEFPRGSPDKHIIARGVQHPVVALPGVVVMSRHFDEAFIETQVVPDGVLPALLVLPVIREVLHDELVDAVEREPLLGTLSDGHHDERVVAERRLVEFLSLFARLLGFVRVALRGVRLDCF